MIADINSQSEQYPPPASRWPQPTQALGVAAVVGFENVVHLACRYIILFSRSPPVAAVRALLFGLRGGLLGAFGKPAR